jgi:hypothetical protein
VTWDLVLKIIVLGLVFGILINTVAADLIEKWKK